MEVDKTVIFHDYFTRDENGKKVLKKKAKTFAIAWRGSERIVSIVRCSPKDQYCKKKGRNIALNRLKSHLKGKDVINVTSYNNRWEVPTKLKLPDWTLVDIKKNEDVIPF